MKIQILFFIAFSNLAFGQNSILKIIDEKQPQGYFVKEYYPTPFSPITGTEFGIKDTSYVKISIVSRTTKDTIRIIYDDKLSHGIYSVIWDLRKDNGERYKKSDFVYLIIEAKREKGFTDINFTSKIRITLIGINSN